MRLLNGSRFQNWKWPQVYRENNLVLELLAVTTKCAEMKFSQQKGCAWKHKIWFVKIMEQLSEALELCHRNNWTQRLIRSPACPNDYRRHATERMDGRCGIRSVFVMSATLLYENVCCRKLLLCCTKITERILTLKFKLHVMHQQKIWDSTCTSLFISSFKTSASQNYLNP